MGQKNSWIEPMRKTKLDDHCNGRSSAANLNTILWLSIAVFMLMMTSCNKNELEDYGASIDVYQDYLPLRSGQLNYYRLDSTVVAPFGTGLIIHPYLVKDSVGKMTISSTDTTYVVYRFLSDTLVSQPWAYSSTYRIVMSAHTAQRIDEQNRRFVILASPVKAGYSWEGNRYFTSDQEPGDFYYGWTYTYHMDEDLGELQSVSGATDLLSVDQVDITNGNPGEFDQSLFQEIIYAREVYGRGTGLVQKTVTHITYQANQSNPNVFGYYQQESFKIQLTRIKAPKAD